MGVYAALRLYSALALPFFVVSIPTSSVSMINMLPDEHTTHRAYRWWTCRELLASSETFQPMQLPQLVQPLFDGILPFEPIDIPR